MSRPSHLRRAVWIADRTHDAEEGDDGGLVRGDRIKIVGTTPFVLPDAFRLR
jgi:hypothetical protein